jgi:hypothetical protein
MTHTAVMTGLAPALLATASSRDPIFAVIEWYRRACAVLEATDEMDDPGFHAVAKDEVNVSRQALFTTVPTSPAGWRALADFIGKKVVEDTFAEFDWWHRPLGVLITALERSENQAV